MRGAHVQLDESHRQSWEYKGALPAGEKPLILSLNRDMQIIDSTNKGAPKVGTNVAEQHGLQSARNTPKPAVGGPSGC